MFCVTPFQVNDARLMNAWAPLAVAPGSDPLTWEQGGPAYTARRHGQIIACGGVLIPWAGLGQAWAIITPEGRRYPRYVHFATRGWLRQIITAHDLRRIEATVALPFAEGHRWVRLLGFEEDGLADGYLPDGGDAIRYVLRTKETRV